jgi:poly(A) polymerase
VDHRSIDSFTYLSFYRSSQSTSDIALKLTENSLTETNLPAVSETFVSKDWSDKKTPQLPFGENVAVATAANTTQ